MPFNYIIMLNAHDRHRKQSCAMYVADFYKTSSWRQMYSGEVMPIIHPDDWIAVDSMGLEKCEPPGWVRQAGRPRDGRIPGGAESSIGARRQICSRCGGTGHNRRKCDKHIDWTAEIIGANDAQQQDGPRRQACSVCRRPGHRKNKCPELRAQPVVDEGH